MLVRYNSRFKLTRLAPLLAHASRQDLRAARDRAEVVSLLGIAGALQPVVARRCSRVLHPAAAAERDRDAAHGARVPADADGLAHSLAPDARRQHAVAARYRSRRHRHPDRGRESAARRRHDAARAWPRALHRARLGLEARIGLNHHQPDAQARRVGRLVARALHHGRRTVQRRARHLRAFVQRRTDLSRQETGELGPGARHRIVRSRSRKGRRERDALGDPLSARRRQRFHRGGHHAAGDDAGRRRGGGQSRGRTLHARRRQRSRAAVDRSPHSGDRRCVRRQGLRHRRGEDHAGARFQRLRGRAAAR